MTAKPNTSPNKTDDSMTYSQFAERMRRLMSQTLASNFEAMIAQTEATIARQFADTKGQDSDAKR